MRKSINAGAFSPGTSITDMARAAAEAGFAAIELVVGDEGALTPHTDEAACRAVRTALTDANLTPSALGTRLFWENHYASPEPSDRRRAIDLTLAMLDRAAWIGAEAIVVVPAVVGRKGDRAALVPYADALNRAHDALCELHYEAEARGIQIAVENVWNRFLLSPVETARFIDRLATPWIGVCFDIGNVMPFGYPDDWIATLGRRIVRVHIKDLVFDNAGGGRFCPLGEGDVQWPTVLGALKRAGYRGPLTYEGQGDLRDISRRMDALWERTTSACASQANDCDS